MVEKPTPEKEDDLDQILDGYFREEDPAPYGEGGGVGWKEENETDPRRGVDGREAVPVELMKKFPPSLLRKRRRTGRYKYCLRELNGARAKVDDTDPVSVPAMRRRINGRRRILKSSSMMEDQSDRPARKMVVVELDGSHDVGQK